MRGRDALATADVLGVTVRVGEGLPGLNLARAESQSTWAAGGNLDINLTRYLAIRVIQADYIPTEFENEKQHNGRVSAGVVFRVVPR